MGLIKIKCTNWHCKKISSFLSREWNHLLGKFKSSATDISKSLAKADKNQSHPEKKRVDSLQLEPECRQLDTDPNIVPCGKGIHRAGGRVDT